MRWLDTVTYSMDMNLSQLQETMEDRGAWQATYSPWSPKESDMTEPTEQQPPHKAEC